MNRFTLSAALVIAASHWGTNSSASAAVVYEFANNGTVIGGGLDGLASGSFTVSGIELTATAIGGEFNATSGNFGVNQPASGDDTDGFDFQELGGPGTSEGILLSFNSAVVLSSIDVSSFGSGDEVTISFSGGTIAVVTSSGSNSLGSTVIAANDPITVLTTGGSYGNGWSLDSVELTAIPEPATALLGSVAAVALAGRRRRRR